MEERYNNTVSNNEFCFGTARKPITLCFISDIGTQSIFFVSDHWYCQMQTTRLLKFLNAYLDGRPRLLIDWLPCQHNALKMFCARFIHILHNSRNHNSFCCVHVHLQTGRNYEAGKRHFAKEIPLKKTKMNMPELNIALSRS